MLCISLGTVSAADDTGNNTTTNNTTSVSANFTNPGFESGNTNGWTNGSTTTITTNSHSGNYAVHFYHYANQSTDNLTQNVDLTNVNNITFWGYGEGTTGTTYSFYVYIDNILINTIIPNSNNWTEYTISTQGYTGFHNITITWFGGWVYGADVDDFSINAPTANFTANTTNGNSPLTVQFTDTSTNKPTSWLWNFGDGTTSTDENPTHTYTTPGIYTVTLTATNAAANNTITQNNYITVMDTTMPIVVANNNTGSYNTTLNITLTTVDPYGATTTYYTTDGSDPQTSSTRIEYTEPITITENTTIRYSAINSLGIWSPEYTQTYTIDLIPPTVTSNLNNGTYNTTQNVTLTTTDSNSNDTTYYTTDGTDPQTSTTRTTYTEPITINTTTTLRYAAQDPAGNWSPTYIQNYIIGTITTTTDTNYTGPSTNTTYWTYKVGSSGTYSVVNIGSDGTIYVGTWNEISEEGALYAFYSNGTLKWKYTTYGGIYATPTIGSDGTIYVGTYWGAIYAINPNGTQKWNYTGVSSVTSYITSPIVLGPDGTVYASVDNVGLYAFYSNGTLKWSGKGGRASITIDSNGVIHCGNLAYNQDGTTSTETTTTSETVGPDGTIYTINWATITATKPDGTTWSYTCSDEILSYFIGSDGTVYLSVISGLEGFDLDRQQIDLYAINSNGTVKWTYHTGGSRSIAVASDGTLYVGGYTTGVFYAIKDVPVAGFTSNTTTGDSPLNVQFTDTSSNPTSWTWDFGDGNTSTDENPTHTYTKPGTYTVTLTITNSYGNSTTTSTITVLDTTSPTVTSNLNNGTYNTTQNVTLTSTDDSGNSTIYYTTDGTDPTNSTTRTTYTQPITINTTTTLRYAAVDSSNNWSSIYNQNYTIDTTSPTASANVKSGTYNTNKAVTLSMSENGTIYYTTDGTTPTTNSKKYTGPITISSTTTLRYIAVDLAGNTSPIYTTKYVIDKVAPTVKSTNPKNGATGVARSTSRTITITFSKNIKLYNKSLWSKIYIKNSKGQKISISKYINGNKLTIKINTKKTANTWYTVYIPAGAISDSVGNKLKKAYTFKFKTGRY